MITSINHVAVSVADLERSLTFYRDLIGLEVVRILDCPPEVRLGEVVGMPGCAARIAHLKIGNDMLELFEYLDPRGRPIPTDRKQADNGWIHIGFASSDARGDYARLKASGVRFIGEPVEFRPNVWIVYFHGPDGEVCELKQSPEDDA